MLTVLKLLQPIPQSPNTMSNTSKSLPCEAENSSLLDETVIDAAVPWIELAERERWEEKGKIYEPEHEAIFAEFGEIKHQLKELLNHNERAPVEERFPLQVFNLNAEATEKLTQEVS